MNKVLSMRFLGMAFAMLLSIGQVEAGEKSPSVELRSGFSVGSRWGVHAGAYANVPQSRLFSWQTGVLFSSIAKWEQAAFQLYVPVYASFHFPLSSVTKVRVSGGAYGGIGVGMNAGPTMDIGVEWKNFTFNAFGFLDCTSNSAHHTGVSFGYKIDLGR